MPFRVTPTNVIYVGKKATVSKHSAGALRTLHGLGLMINSAANNKRFEHVVVEAV